MGIGDWAQSPIPNPKSPIPNPQSPIPNILKIKYIKNKNLLYLNIKLNKEIILYYILIIHKSKLNQIYFLSSSLLIFISNFTGLIKFSGFSIKSTCSLLNIFFSKIRS